jgi:RNA polymerase sigma factor (sigma-70 family)
MSLTAGEWLESPYLPRLAARIAAQFGLKPQDVPDLLQEVRIALWRAGSDQRVNVSWISRTAEHKAADHWRRKRHEQERLVHAPEVRIPITDSNAELLHLLRARAAILPTPLRKFYALRYEEGRSEREIALRLGLCRGSVRWMDEVCRKWLRGRGAPPEASASSLAHPA